MSNRGAFAFCTPIGRGQRAGRVNFRLTSPFHCADKRIGEGQQLRFYVSTNRKHQAERSGQYTPLLCGTSKGVDDSFLHPDEQGAADVTGGTARMPPFHGASKKTDNRAAIASLYCNGLEHRQKGADGTPAPFLL